MRGCYWRTKMRDGRTMIVTRYADGTYTFRILGKKA